MRDRERLESDYLDYLRGRFQKEFEKGVPSYWSERIMEHLEELELEEAAASIQKLTKAPLENEYAMHRHADRSVAKLRKAIEHRPWKLTL
jgi:hypothetical protein